MTCPRKALVPLVAAVCCALLSGCSEQPRAQLSIGSSVRALGVPQNGFPSYEELVVFTLTNRARSDPDAELDATCTSCPPSLTYPVADPLVYDTDLSRAARFHATSLRKAGAGLQHESICKLASDIGSTYPDQCDGSPSCACDGSSADCECSGGAPYCSCPGGCTSTSQRVGLFAPGLYRGENAAAGNTDPRASFAQWINSNAGHRDSLMSQGHSRLGVGEYSGSGSCWNAYWVQVFGGSPLPIPKIPGAVHYPQSSSPTQAVTFWANYFDSAGPQLATVNIDGTCHPLNLERGSTAHGAFATARQLASGCHRYYFVFRDKDGALVTYPSSGSFGVGINSSCTFFVGNERPALGQGCGECATAADCGDGDPCTTDSCGADHKCHYAQVADCCHDASECGDGDVCTTDSCGADHKCHHGDIADCCHDASECGDGDVCTTDSCGADHKCHHSDVADCCNQASECGDGDVCTTDSCGADHKCHYSDVPDCCHDASECDDGVLCTEDTCSANACVHTAIPACCSGDGECDDSDPCTADRCEASDGTCRYQAVAGCCNVDLECDDGDVCTDDSCLPDHSCQHAPRPGCAVAAGGLLAGADGGASDGASSPDGGTAGGDGGDGDGPINKLLPTPGGRRLDGGCGVAGGASGSSWVLALLALALGLRRRR